MAFDRYLSARTEKRGKAKVFMYAASTVAHGAAFAGLLFWTFWQVEKVQGKPTAVVFVAERAPPPPPAPTATPPAPVDPQPKPKPIKVAVTETVQPTPHVQPIPDPPVSSGGTDTGATGTDLNGTSGSTGVPGGTGPVVEEPRREPQKATIVDESLIGAARIAGVREIPLPLDVKQALVAQGRRTTQASVMLCLDIDGVPNRIEIAGSTGFPSADAAIKSEMSAWRYRPYRVNGAPVPVCTAVMFKYTIGD